MHTIPKSLQTTGSKTAVARLRWYDAAVISRFQSRRGVPETVGAACSTHPLPSDVALLFKLCSVAGDRNQNLSSEKSALAGFKLLRGITQELSQLICRIKKTCFDCVCPVSIRNSTAHSMQPAYFWITRVYGRLQTETVIALQHFVHGSSVYLAADGEYIFRRVKRQRVFHEKGNAD